MKTAMSSDFVYYVCRCLVNMYSQCTCVLYALSGVVVFSVCNWVYPCMVRLVSVSRTWCSYVHDKWARVQWCPAQLCPMCRCQVGTYPVCMLPAQLRPVYLGQVSMYPACVKRNCAQCILV